MALSNIGNEPRREITESLIGIAAVAAYIAADYLIVTRWFGITRTVDIVGCTTIFGLLALVGIPAFAIITHFIGEQVCDALGRADPRPRRRY